MSGKSDRRGLMLVLSSPSGAGKSTIAQLLLKEMEQIVLSISVTTRERRSSEVDGVHYHFIDHEEFHQMIERDELLEWAEVHGNYYGTPRKFVENRLEAGQDVLFDIDVQGTRQLREKMPEDIATVFILPPSVEEMKARLKRRAEDSDETIARRLKTAVGEMEQWTDYDYLIVNHDLNLAFSEAKAVLQAERLRQTRQSGNATLARQLFSDLKEITGTSASGD